MQAPKNKYNYLDPINQYTLKNGVLRNLPNIEDEKVLLAYESLKVSNRIEELFDNPITIVDSSALLKIHKHLFQDVYEWAGEKRRVEINQKKTVKRSVIYAIFDTTKFTINKYLYGKFI